MASMASKADGYNRVWDADLVSIFVGVKNPLKFVVHLAQHSTKLQNDLDTHIGVSIIA